MDTHRIIEALNSARSRELAVIVQYMEHHYEVARTDGVPSGLAQFGADIWLSARKAPIRGIIRRPSTAPALKAIAKAEMLHAQSFGLRVIELGGTPTITVDERCKATTIREMLDLDIAAEDDAIARYTEYAYACLREGDSESHALFERILAEEEEHAATFRVLAESLR